MLDTFEILTTSGVVLWSRSFAPVSPSIINNFIADTFIEEKGASAPSAAAARDSLSASKNPPYKSEQHTLRWTFSKELGIIFVAVYRSLLHLSWIDKLVDHIKLIFVDLYADQIKKPNTTIVECQKFDGYFDQQYRELEASGDSKPQPQIEELSQDPIDPPGLKHRTPALDPAADDSTPASSRPSTPGNASSHLVVAKAGPGGAKMSRRARKMQNAASSAPMSSGDEGSSRKTKKGPKKGRKWDADGYADEEDDVQLDYSTGPRNAVNSDSEIEATAKSTAVDSADARTWGTTTSRGQFVLRDLGDEVHSILRTAEEKEQQAEADAQRGGIVGSITGLFRNVIGGKTLTREDLDKALKGMEDHLLRKNVAREAALRLCEGVREELIGSRTGNFESIDSRIQTAMEASLTKMLTPTSSLDLLREIDAVVKPASGVMRDAPKPRPYVMSIVGVNGVGKSTNLSKICYFLLVNKYRVLVVAGDTFRSGAVEQLKVHVRNLKEMTEREGGSVDLFEKGYGGDAATVAKDAVREAEREGYDVVLIDTAGRRHNDQRLMSSLEKFAKFAQPDKILMVGEALVGTDSVLKHATSMLRSGRGRRLDGFIISKCDTVGDMVGTLVSIVHATTVPVLFVGVGQHYSDIRNFSVRWAVQKLLASG